MREKIFDLLNKLKIEYKNYEHLPVFTCEDAKILEDWEKIPWKRVKTLFLRNKKWNNYYLVTVPDNKSLDLKEFREIIKDSKLSFWSEERMIKKIWIKPWRVSPFALINNTEKDLKFYIDEDLKNSDIWIHPLQNDNTTVLNLDSLKIFLDNLWFEINFIKI